MEIPFRSQFDSRHFAFYMVLEPQNISGFYDGDVRYLYVQAYLKRDLHKDEPQQGLYPVMLNFHGKLYRMNNPQDYGATLLPIADTPISVLPGVPQLVNLSFTVSPSYLRILEEHRASQQTQDMLLQMRMWGVAAMIKPHAETPNVPHYQQDRSGEVVGFEKVSTETYDPQIKIERSAWVDRILPGLGYRQSVLIELPLVRTPPIPEAYQKAAEALDMARKAFEQEDYRGAIKYGREVLEHLGNTTSDKRINTFCKEYLESRVGETKSQTVEGTLKILYSLTSAGSHANSFVADRSIAAYVVEALALNLRYISSVIGYTL